MAALPRAPYIHRFSPAALVICYSFVVLACLTVRPLWVDEVLQLIRTTSLSVESMVRWVGMNLGAAPLGYLTQRPFVLAAGHSRSGATSLCHLQRGVVLADPHTVQRTEPSSDVQVGSPLQCSWFSQPSSDTLTKPGHIRKRSSSRWLLWLLSRSGEAARPRHDFTLPSSSSCWTVHAARCSVCGVRPCRLDCVVERPPGAWRAAIPWTAICIPFLLFLPWYMFASRQWDVSIQQSGYPKFHWTSPWDSMCSKGSRAAASSALQRF